jgi:hypothetical protein
LRQLAVIEPDVAQDGLFELFAAAEVMALQDVLDAAVEPLDHAIGLRVHRRCEAVLDAELGAEVVEVVAACGAALSQAEEGAVNSVPLSVRTVRMRIGQARSRSLRKRRAFAAVLAG